MSKKTKTSKTTNEAPAGTTSHDAKYVEECLCGCGQDVQGQTMAFVAGHDAELVLRTIAEEYGSAAEFAMRHWAGAAVSGSWELTPWHPETAVGQQARGRVFKPLTLFFHGLAELDTNGRDYGGSRFAEAYGIAVDEAGPRLDVELDDPYAEERYDNDMTTSGPAWNAALVKLEKFDSTWDRSVFNGYEKKYSDGQLELEEYSTFRLKLISVFREPPFPTFVGEDELLEYTASRSKLVKALDQARDAPSPFETPGEAARRRSWVEKNLKHPLEETVQICEDATEENVLDVDSWVFLAAEAYKAGRLQDALGFAEAAVAVVERSLPESFSGTLRMRWPNNRGYLVGRYLLTMVLWKLKRFDDAYRVCADTVWLDPQDGQRILQYVEQLVPSAASANADPFFGVTKSALNDT